MKRARITVLVFTLAIPALYWIAGYAFVYLPQVSEIESGKSVVYRRILDERLKASIVPAEQTRNQHGASSELDRLLREGELEPCPSPSDFCFWSKKIDQEPETLPPKVQAIVRECKQEAKEQITSKFLNDYVKGTLLVIAPLMAVGMIAVWVMKPEQVRQHIRVGAQVAMAGWTMYVVLRLANTEFGYNRVSEQVIRSIALWVAGLVPCLLTFYWTRPPKE